MEKKLYKDQNNKKIFGVCAGVAKYFGWDPTLVRLIWVVVTLFAGAGLLAYIIAALIMQNEP